MRHNQILIPSIIQDPHVISIAGEGASMLHPIFANDSAGFNEGPVCNRIAVVDIDPDDGSMRPPVGFLESGKTSVRPTYKVTLPCGSKGKWRPMWAIPESCKRGGIADLERPDYRDPFLKVNAFGTVLRTLDFIESPMGLDRRIEWGFPGKQLLIVPQAGEFPNAFYHRESHSLQLFFFHPDPGADRIVYSALSQDIVAHEAAHAAMDGIAPDLYDACLVDSLAIHEALADITAVLLAIRSRDRVEAFAHDAPAALNELLSSSRFSRIAEEFRFWRGHGDCLRDVNNNKSIAPDAEPGCQVDAASPHSLSEVLSGALFAVYVQTFNEFSKLDQKQPLLNRDRKYTFGSRDVMQVSACRLASLIYKGLDWLPPGEVTLAEYAQACLAADSFFVPKRAGQRQAFADECRKRGIFRADETTAEPSDLDLQPLNINRLRDNLEARDKFVQDHRDLLRIPEGKTYKTSARIVQAGDEPFLSLSARTAACNLSGPPRKGPIHAPKRLLILKVAWDTARPCHLGPEFGQERLSKTGTTLAIGPSGQIHMLLHGRTSTAASRRSEAFLGALYALGSLLPPGHTLGPDGKPIHGYITSEQHEGGIRISGAYCALHIAEDPL